MYTANTLSSAIEALGLSLPGSASTPAATEAKMVECREAGRHIRFMLEQDLRPSRLLTRRSFLNAMHVVVALGGSTNAVIHLLAMAKAARVELSIEDW